MFLCDGDSDCPAGDDENKENCVPTIDECKIPGICSQLCTNELGSFKVIFRSVFFSYRLIQNESFASYFALPFYTDSVIARKDTKEIQIISIGAKQRMVMLHC